MIGLSLLLTAQTLAPTHGVAVQGCPEHFTTQFQNDWTVESADFNDTADLVVTCLANGQVMIELRALHIRKTVDPQSDEHVSQERVVAVIAAELLSEQGRRKPLAVKVLSQEKITVAAAPIVAAPVVESTNSRSSTLSLQAAAFVGLKNSLDELPKGLQVGVARSSLAASANRGYVGMLEGAYETSTMQRSLGTVHTGIFSGSALWGAESFGTDFHVALLGGIRAGRASVSGTPFLATNHGDEFSAFVISPLLRFVLSVPVKRVSAFTTVDGGYSLTNVRAHVGDERDATLSGLWINVGIGVLLSLQ